MILHDVGYTKGICYNSASLLHKQTTGKKTTTIDLSKVTGQSIHKIEPGNAFQMKGALTKKGVTVRIYSEYTSKEMQWVVRSSTRVLVFTKRKVVLKFYTVLLSKGKGDAA